ncbi:MAG TPA: MoxR family ATPase [Solirubrobacteraceae bacterium]|nr:MoxR family ATPase [Solirubrobacteraceae bacterium]
MASEPERGYPEADYHYTRDFDPEPPSKPEPAVAMQGGDRPQQSPYVYNEEIILAVNTALAAGRPLLVGGAAGTGKSALAQDIAKQREMAFVQKVITGRTEGRDLLWRFDTVRRLRDAHLAVASRKAGESPDVLDEQNYLDKGVLWEAFVTTNPKGAVVLIDEIDKADPDVPNSLLEVLGNGKFTIDETRAVIEVNDARPPFIVITTNNERELSRPFRRRCVTLRLEEPSEARLVEIATAWGLADGDALVTAQKLATEMHRRAKADATGDLKPNAAEYLDALRACLELGVEPGSQAWEAILVATVNKPLDEPRAQDGA